MAAKPKAEAVAPVSTEPTDGPLMDGMTAAVKKMIQRGRERGYITYDEINAALPPEQYSSEQIEDTLAMLNEQGINVVEAEEEETEKVEPEREDDEDDSDDSEYGGGNLDADSIGRTDDPVRMYLREMGSIELLSREGEIAIAKRIEAGRDKMIGGLCESPLSMRALVRMA
jgi:DNA-directed RNA polymerase, sigma subunit (sigma70/sigma32)